MKQNSDRNDKANICNKERPQEGNDRRTDFDHWVHKKTEHANTGLAMLVWHDINDIIQPEYPFQSRDRTYLSLHRVPIFLLTNFVLNCKNLSNSF